MNFYHGADVSYGWRNVTGGRGYIYTTPDGMVAGLYGGYWNVGSDAGSRSSRWGSYVWGSNFGIGLRGRCEHIVVP